jgi:hypothetical protein
MPKNTLKKTGGCKAARPCKTSAAQSNQLTELCSARNRNEAAAREHTLQAALEYYLPALRCEPEKQRVDMLRKLVFGNWLQQHAFPEKFQPVLGIAR